MLDPGGGKTKTGYLWALARDYRRRSGADPPAVAYMYAPGRGAEHATRHLTGFSGVQVDGYVAYKQLADPKRVGGPLVLAHCWSHFRRRFYDVTKGGNAPIASEALIRIAELYGIEEEIRGQNAEARRTVRQTRTKPLVDTLEDWLEKQLARLSKGSTTAGAIRYGLNHWTGTGGTFKQGRDFAAWLGLVPRQVPTDGRTKLAGLSKRGNCYLRTLFVQAAHVILVKKPAAAQTALWPWISTWPNEWRIGICLPRL